MLLLIFTGYPRRLISFICLLLKFDLKKRLHSDRGSEDEIWN